MSQKLKQGFMRNVKLGSGSLRLLNRNYMGTHFGGSLYAMTDPFFALLIMHQLGRRYVVWDKASTIDYKLPGRGTVHATFRTTPEQIDAIRQATAGGDKHEPVFSVDVLNRQGEVVATVNKTIYVRLKPVSAKA